MKLRKMLFVWLPWRAWPAPPAAARWPRSSYWRISRPSACKAGSARRFISCLHDRRRAGDAAEPVATHSTSGQTAL